MKLTNEHKLYIEFSVGCAYRVLHRYEAKYPNNNSPRKALEAAQAFLEKPSAKTKKAADAAYAAADAAADAAYAAYAAYAADAAAYAAADAAYAAYAAYAAAYAADAAYAAAYAAAEREWQCKFLFALNTKYRLSLKIGSVEGKE